jgi:hypothetical protein
MTLPHPHTLFNPPIKVSDPSNDIYLITGLWKYYDRVLVIHDRGYTDLKVVSKEVRERVEEKVKEITIKQIT